MGSWTVYLSGEIHSDWRERIHAGVEAAGLAVEFSIVSRFPFGIVRSTVLVNCSSMDH